MKANRYLFLGDSLTMRHDWSAFEAANMGIDGDTTEGVLQRMHLSAEAEHVVLMIGINDILMQIPLAAIQNNYTKILKNFPQGQKVTLLSLLPVVDVKQTQGINRDIKTINLWLKAETQNSRFDYIDLYPYFLDANRKGLKEEYTTDGIHLSEKGYEVWEKVLKKNLR